MEYDFLKSGLRFFLTWSTSQENPQLIVSAANEVLISGQARSFLAPACPGCGHTTLIPGLFVFIFTKAL